MKLKPVRFTLDELEAMSHAISMATAGELDGRVDGRARLSRNQGPRGIRAPRTAGGGENEPRVPAAAPDRMDKMMTPGWCVRVSVFDDLVVSIEERELCGRDLSEADLDLIRGCARHLLSFVGDVDRAAAPDVSVLAAEKAQGERAGSTPATVQAKRGNHTPGPWTVFKGVYRNDHPETSADVRGPHGEHVANCGCAPVAIDNARLIAAAPDLLEACRLFVEWYMVENTEQKRDEAFFAAQAVLTGLMLPNQRECRCDCVNCVTGNHGDCYYRPSTCPSFPPNREVWEGDLPREQR